MKLNLAAPFSISCSSDQSKDLFFSHRAIHYLIVSYHVSWLLNILFISMHRKFSVGLSTWVRKNFCTDEFCSCRSVSNGTGWRAFFRIAHLAVQTIVRLCRPRVNARWNRASFCPWRNCVNWALPSKANGLRSCQKFFKFFYSVASALHFT